MLDSWIDIHCHLDRLDGGPEAALRLAQENGVGRLISIGTEPEDLPVVLALAQQFKDEVYCTLGVHPHEGVKYSQDVEDFILKHATEPEVVAVGEIGLDYYYNQSPKKEQIDAFEAQLALADQLNLPVEIHTRDAEEDTIEILKKYKGKVNGVIHCFTGTEWLARQSLDLGFNISISGIVTFKNAESLRNIVKNVIPLDRLHVETDAPFLAPVPVRGKPNTSAYMIHTAKFVAGLKDVSLDDLRQQTNLNAKNLFKKLK
jgi:TatD DNase family protein